MTMRYARDDGALFLGLDGECSFHLSALQITCSEESLLPLCEPHIERPKGQGPQDTSHLPLE